DMLNKKYLQLGGAEIQIIEQGITHVNEKLSSLQKNVAQYQGFARQFSLKEEISLENFADNREKLTELLASHTSLFEEARQATLAISGQLVIYRQDINQLREELNDIQSRKNSSIPRNFQIFR